MSKYLKYFKIPFIIAGVVAVICIVAYFIGVATSSEGSLRNNEYWTSDQRVFDYADKLTPEDELILTNHIYELERQAYVDMAVLILDEDLTPYVDARRDKLGYDVPTSRQVMVYADDFSYENGLGWNGFNGDAIVFIDNWSREADGSVYSWVSTAGRCISMVDSAESSQITSNDLSVLSDNATSAEIRDAYMNVMSDLAAESISADGIGESIKWYYVIIGAFVISVIYVIINARSKVGDVTVSDKTYVKDGSVVFAHRADIFLRKSVSRSEKSSSSGGGGGGSHSSSGGGSFGGGGSSR